MKRSPPIQYIVADLCLTKITRFSVNHNEHKKFLEKYRGPFKIVEVLPNDRYSVKENIHFTRTKRQYETVAGIEHIKLYNLKNKNVRVDTYLTYTTNT